MMAAVCNNCQSVASSHTKLDPFDGLDFKRCSINPALRFVTVHMRSLLLVKLNKTELQGLTYGLQSTTPNLCGSVIIQYQ